MACPGPCLPHCWRCPAHVAALAYASLAYALACGGYLALTCNLGTPFRAALTPAQRAILARAVRARRAAFERALLLAVALLAAWRPLRRAP